MSISIHKKNTVLLTLPRPQPADRDLARDCPAPCTGLCDSPGPGWKSSGRKPFGAARIHCGTLSECLRPRESGQHGLLNFRPGRFGGGDAHSEEVPAQDSDAITGIFPKPSERPDLSRVRAAQAAPEA